MNCNRQDTSKFDRKFYRNSAGYLRKYLRRLEQCARSLSQRQVVGSRRRGSPAVATVGDRQENFRKSLESSQDERHVSRLRALLGSNDRIRQSPEQAGLVKNDDR